MTFTALKNAVLSEKIDWLAYSQASYLEWDYPDCFDNHWKRINALRYYTNGEENKQGVKRYWNNIRSDQGKSTVLDGASLDTMREDLSIILHGVNTPERKATRIDFAIDITHSKLRPETASEYLRRGEFLSHASSARRIDDSLIEGYTQYVGTKYSDTYTRIYDKAVEQKTPYAWVRIETVYQGERAKPALSALLSGKSIGSLICSHVDFPTWNDWKQIMPSERVKLQIQKKETRTRAWLLSTVAKSIANELAMDEEHSFWFELQSSVAKELAILEKKADNIEW